MTDSLLLLNRSIPFTMHLLQLQLVCDNILGGRERERVSGISGGRGRKRIKGLGSRDGGRREVGDEDYIANEHILEMM